MSAEAGFSQLARSQRDWRIWFGLTVTVGWLAFGAQYVLGIIGWERFSALPADGVGGFLEGAFAPLAFLWLVIGFFLQQRELGQNTEALRVQYELMRKSADQAEIQARAITLNEAHQHRETFLKVVDLVSKQMGVTAGFLYMSSQISDDSDEELQQRALEGWNRLGSGDPEIFSRRLMAVCFAEGSTPEVARELFWSTEIRSRHSSSFCQAFERLLSHSQPCDFDDTLRDALEGSAHGIVYRMMNEGRGA